VNHLTPDQVSCVIPYAGAQKYLADVVGSAVRQRFHEIVIVNDGFDPQQLAVVATLPQVRVIHLPQSVGCPNARNLGIKACRTRYVVMLDHDDLLAGGYLPAILSWMGSKGLRCAAATLRYIGESPKRVGAVVSRHPDFFLPSGFCCEVALLAEVGYFPDSCGDDLLLFKAIRKVTTLTTCPEAGVLYRIHPQAESSRNVKLWWAFTRLLPLYEQGRRSLSEINAIARTYTATGEIPAGLETLLADSTSAQTRLLARSAYACWLNRDLPGLVRYAGKIVGHIPELWRLVRVKIG